MTDPNQSTDDAKDKSEAGDTSNVKPVKKAGAKPVKKTSAKPKTEPKPKKEERRPIVLVTSSKPRRRAGRRFGPVPTKIYDGDLDEKQIVAITNDPMLKVVPFKE